MQFFAVSKFQTVKQISTPNNNVIKILQRRAWKIGFRYFFLILNLGTWLTLQSMPHLFTVDKYINFSQICKKLKSAKRQRRWRYQCQQQHGVIQSSINIFFSHYKLQQISFHFHIKSLLFENNTESSWQSSRWLRNFFLHQKSQSGGVRRSRQPTTSKTNPNNSLPVSGA